MIEGAPCRVFFEPQTARSVALRIAIDEEGALLRRSERSGKIHCRGRFSNATLLVGDGDDLPQEGPRDPMQSSRLELAETRCFTWNQELCYLTGMIGSNELFHVERSIKDIRSIF